MNAEWAGIHRTLAIELFNLTWNLMDRENRTSEDDDRMIHAAHASRYHWGAIGTALEFERGEWQISRVYATLGRAEPALYHARRCLTLCLENAIGDFDLAFAYEALARAHAVAGNHTESRAFIAEAREAGAYITGEGDRDYFFEQLNAVAALLA